MSFLTELETNFWSGEAEVLDSFLATGYFFVPLPVLLTDKQGGYPPPRLCCEMPVLCLGGNNGNARQH